MAAAVSFVAIASGGCADATGPGHGSARAIEASLTADLLEQLPSHEAFAQVYAIRTSGSVEEVGPSSTVDLDEPFVVFANLPSEEPVAYEIRLSQGNARIASATFRAPGEAAVIGEESTVEADAVLNGIRDGIWCEACSPQMVRYFVTRPVASELCDVGKSYQDAIRFYARGVVTGIQAWSDTLRAAGEVDGAAYATLAGELDGIYRDYDLRAAELVEPAAVRTAQRELDLAFAQSFVDAGFSRYTLARAAQVVAEVMVAQLGSIDQRAIPELLFEAQRVRALAVTGYVKERMVAAGIDDMRIAGLNAELMTNLETMPTHGHWAHLIAERAWLAYEMGLLAAFAEAHPEISIGALLLELAPLDVAAKAVVNAIAQEQVREETRAAPITKILDEYRVTVSRAPFHASLPRTGVSKADVTALADAIYFVSIPAHGVPPLLVDL